MKSLILNREKYKDMEYNSKKIKQGDIFVALEGVTVDGHNYINMAIENGAKGIIHSKEIDKKEGIDYY
ncbi:MAG: Mur ligase domain-containing protein, partial [Fusobacteriaceae bacterium]